MTALLALITVVSPVASEKLSWGKSFLTYLKDKAIPSGFNGALIFVWNWVDPNSMTDPTTGKLTAWGAAIVAAIAAPDSGVPAS